MINVNQLRNGRAFELEGEPFLVLKYGFTKMGRGTGNVKVKCRNLKTGAVVSKTFITGNKVQDIQLQRKKRQYLYSDADKSVFMDPESFEQLEIADDLLSEQKQYLIDGMEVQVLFWEDEALAVELPAKLEYEVKETGPGEKGNSATNVFKPAVLLNGLRVKVPLFINIGDKVRVDTRTGEYVERV
jgi:elongation factor P